MAAMAAILNLISVHYLENAWTDYPEFLFMGWAQLDEGCF
jgi:hypothetical protein